MILPKFLFFYIQKIVQPLKPWNSKDRAAHCSNACINRHDKANLRFRQTMFCCVFVEEGGEDCEGHVGSEVDVAAHGKDDQLIATDRQTLESKD